MNISERTVKNDIDHLREACRNCGCILKSVRGKGYILEIRDTERFAQTREWINILFNNVEKDVKENQSYQLARAIMCGQTADDDGFFQLEELAVSLYASLSTIKKKMPWVRNFLESYGVELISRPGRGLRLQGDELSQRLCMLELYENHFRTRVVSFDNYTYERAFADLNDKDQIRNCLLYTSCTVKYDPVTNGYLSFCRRFQTCNHSQDCGLSAAGGAQKGDKGIVINMKIQVIHCIKLSPPFCYIF